MTDSHKNRFELTEEEKAIRRIVRLWMKRNPNLAEKWATESKGKVVEKESYEVSEKA